MTGLASTAYDPERELFIYTTNNNTFYRDVHVLDVESGETRLLFENARVGQLTVSPGDPGALGRAASAGRASLVYSEFPYETLRSVVSFAYGDTVQHLALSPSGRSLAATLHQSTGRQAIVVTDVERLKTNRRFSYQVVTEEGSPEFPSWSPDGTTLYWSAYTSGVSNVYRYRSDTRQVEALSNTLRGLFRPVHVDSETLFAFEFGPEGFTPVLIPNEPVEAGAGHRVPGTGGPRAEPRAGLLGALPRLGGRGRAGNGGGRPPLQRSLPTPGRFPDAGSQRVPGPSRRRPQRPIHRPSLTARPELRGRRLAVHGSAAGARAGPVRVRAALPRLLRAQPVELLRSRQPAVAGRGGHQDRLRAHQALEARQASQHHPDLRARLLTGVESIHDNLVPVATPRFLSFETSLHSRNVRRAIGGVDNESGTEWTTTLNALGLDSRIVGGLHADWNWYSTVARPHNVFHLQLAGGYASAPREVAIGQYYLGGFGNQLLENKGVKQFRDPLRFPGVPVYSLPTGGFAKVMVEHNLPPLRFDGARVGSHALSHVDASWFAQGLVRDTAPGSIGRSLGAQVNLVFEHWSNLESTVSAGVARAWLPGRDSWEWFVSIKLLRN